MRCNLLTRAYVILAVATVGCAGAQVTQQSSASPITTSRPTQVFVYPFAVNSSDVSLNASIFQVAYRNVTDENETAEQAQIAHQTSQNICVRVAADLTQKGIVATCLQRGTPPSGNNVLILDGQFIDISEGNKLRRMVIGLGGAAAAASLGVNLAAGGVKNYTSSTGYLVDKTTDQIVELIVSYYNRQGW